MNIQINFGDIDHSDAVSTHVTQCVQASLKHHADRVTRVEVHLRDDRHNRKGPDDNRCLMEVRLAGEQPLAVEARADNIYDAVRQAAHKLERAVTRKVERSEP
jgi:ribosomal subunit interface protein